MFNDNRLINLPDAELLFIENFYTPSVSDAFLKALTTELAWKQGEITLFGKKVLEPRLSAWYGDAGETYTYSGKNNRLNPHFCGTTTRGRCLPLLATPLLRRLHPRHP